MRGRRVDRPWDRSSRTCIEDIAHATIESTQSCSTDFGGLQAGKKKAKRRNSPSRAQVIGRREETYNCYWSPRGNCQVPVGVDERERKLEIGWVQSSDIEFSLRSEVRTSGHVDKAVAK